MRSLKFISFVFLVACLSSTSAQAPPAQPKYRFSLTGNNLFSEDQTIQAFSSKVSWTLDPQFGSAVPVCNQELQSYIAIPGLDYGKVTGAFAISLWLKPTLADGDSLDYALSHTQSNSSGTGPNEVLLYFPERAHRDFDGGVVRAIVRDSTDGFEDGSTVTFLDSDGCVADPNCSTTGSAKKVVDGNWHHFVITTHPEGGKGFHMYIDGNQAGVMDPNILYTDELGNTKTATGGFPINLDGPLYLCSRSDREPTRFFDGSVAQLSIFDASLTPDQVKSLYTSDYSSLSSLSGQQQAASMLKGSSVGSLGVALDGTPCSTQCMSFNGQMLCEVAGGVGGGTGTIKACSVPNTSTALSSTSMPHAFEAPSPAQSAGTVASSMATPTTARINGQPVCSAQPISGLETVTACEPGYVCAAISPEQAVRALGQRVDVPLGVCAYAPGGLLLPSTVVVPPPLAFFPLGSQSLESFPLGEYKGISNGAAVVQDNVFGAVLRCRAQDQDVVALDPVPYGSNGPFTINFWFRPLSLNGSAFSYLYSHRRLDSVSSSQANTGWQPNNVQVYLPQSTQPAYGLLRAYVRDNDDLYNGTQSEGYMDSDNTVGFNGPRPASFQSPILDGNFHMATISSQPGGGKGWRMYVDGKLAADMTGNTSYFDGDGNPLDVTGGNPMLLNGDIVLCSRSDDPNDRHFEGDLSYLSLWGEALNETQVKALYDPVSIKVATVGDVTNPNDQGRPTVNTRASNTTVTIYSTTGRPCQFPTLYNGEYITECVFIDGEPYCPVADSVWEPCATTNSSSFSSSPFSSNFTTSITGGGLRTTDGGACQTPLNYSGIEIDSCVNIAGGYYCWAEQTNDWARCDNSTLTNGPALNETGVDSGAVPVILIPFRTRTTVNGELCDLPTVVNGSVIDDCVMRDGALSCPTRTGSWSQCRDTSGSRGGGKGGSNELYVAQRVALSGANCKLPMMYNGYVWFDCAIYNGPYSTSTPSTVCPTTNGTFEVCRDASDVTYVDAFNKDTALKRYTPGILGQLCQLEPTEKHLEQNCGANLACLPTDALHNYTAMEGLGFCARRPPGGTFGVFGVMAEKKMHVPLAFFPLTDPEDLGSLTAPTYEGRSVGDVPLTWVNDTVVGSALYCNNSLPNAISLDPVPYGRSGSFAVSLWMRRPPGSDISGQYSQYLFSHASMGSAGRVGPNQVGIYLPERYHPAYGSVRAFVMDENDVAFSYVDSDGKINADGDGSNTTTVTTKKPKIDVNDGAWHMVTLSTLSDDKEPAYTLFIDGKPTVTLTKGSKESVNRTSITPTGGDPTLMNDGIYLCARSDLRTQMYAERYYSGELAHLMLWDDALKDDDVKALYEQYQKGSKYDGSVQGAKALDEQLKTSSSSSGFSSSSSTTTTTTSDDGLSGGAIAGIVLGVLASIMIIAGALMLFSRQQKRGNRKTGQFERFEDDPFSAASAAAESGLAATYGRPAPVYGAKNGGADDQKLSIQLSSKLSNNTSYLPDSPLSTVSNMNDGPPATPFYTPAVVTPANYRSSNTPPSTSPYASGSGSNNTNTTAAGGSNERLLVPSMGSFTTESITGGGGGGTTPRAAAGGGGPGSVRSVGSGGTYSEEVDIDVGKRSLIRGRKSGARVVLPSSDEEP